MTTVVIADNKVYCDSQATAGGMITDYDVNKALNLGHCIVVGAGRWSHVVKFQQWVQNSVLVDIAQQEHPYVNIPLPEDLVEDEFTGAILYSDGVVVMFEGANDSFECSQPVFLGSGSYFAAGAINAGADGEAAIAAAISLDPYSGGDVKVESFSEQWTPPTQEELESLSKEDILARIFPKEVATSDGEGVPATSDDELAEVFDNNMFSICNHAVSPTKEIGICMFDTDEEGEITSLVLELDGYPEEVIVSSIWLDDNYSLASLKLLAKDLGITFAHNTKKASLIGKIISHVEGFFDEQ